jgi:hypothetical protein
MCIGVIALLAAGSAGAAGQPDGEDFLAPARLALGGQGLADVRALRAEGEGTRVVASLRGTIRMVDTAMQPKPACIAARRTGPCWPTGRREIT